MTHSSERVTQPIPRIKPGETQQLPQVKPPKYNPRHKKENNTGAKFLAVLTGLVLFLGIVAYVDWSSLGSDDEPSETSTVTRYVTEPGTTQTAPGNTETRTVTAEPTPGPTTTVSLTPSATPTITATVTQTVTATETYNQPVPGPTKTVRETVTETTTVTASPEN